MSQMYLSFVDPAKPEGERWLGACVVHADNVVAGATEAWAQGCNPGGEVAALPVPGRVPDEWVNRLLTQDEAENLPLEDDL